MNQVNRMVYSRRDIKNEDELYDMIGKQVRLLLQTGNTVMLTDEDDGKDSIVIEFMPADGDIRPFWLVDEEWKSAINAHIDIEVRNAEKVVGAHKATTDILKKMGIPLDLDDDDNGNNGGGSKGDA